MNFLTNTLHLFIFVLFPKFLISKTIYTPLLILKHPLTSSTILMQARLLTYIVLIPFTSLPPTSYFLSTWNKAIHLTLSYTFSRFIKPTYTSFFYTNMNECKGLIYIIPPCSEAFFLIINQTLSYSINSVH